MYPEGGVVPAEGWRPRIGSVLQGRYRLLAALATERSSRAAEDLLRQLGRDARPQLRVAAREHPNARVRGRARQLLAEGDRRAFLRFL